MKLFNHVQIKVKDLKKSRKLKAFENKESGDEEKGSREFIGLLSVWCFADCF